MMENIKEIVQKAYEEYGEVTEKDFEVTQKSDTLTIRLNTETPFVGNGFFKIVDTIDNEMTKRGYTNKATEYLFDFCYLTYEK